MIGLPAAYLLAGLLFAGFALEEARAREMQRRWTTVAFLGLAALSFLFGDRLGDVGNGFLALGLAGLAVRGFGGRESGEPAAAAASTIVPAQPQAPLFALALIIPAVALVGALCLKSAVVGGTHLVDPKQTTVVSLALGVIVALAVAAPVLQAGPREPLSAGANLVGTIGWAFMLPQMLAALGAVFALSGVGQAVADLTVRVIAPDNHLTVVCAYTIGMALFTAVMGNAFAAFPVMTAGIGLPLIVRRLHGDPAVMGSIGMLSGFCGTLVTPMAANFNIVPVALLELPDRWAVIRVQAPTALALLVINTALMYALVFRF
jgi:uncharacterized membrane protein